MNNTSAEDFKLLISNIRIRHVEILKKIEIALEPFEKDLFKQLDSFKKSKSNKKYNSIRNKKGDVKWKNDVISRFNGYCCICLSKERIIAHHLNSYKYYLELRITLDNGVCLCNKCHTLFHKLYSNINNSGHFFEFVGIMADDKLKKLAIKASGSIGINMMIESLKESDEKYKLVELEYLTFLKWGNVIFCGVRSLPYNFE